MKRKILAAMAAIALITAGAAVAQHVPPAGSGHGQHTNAYAAFKGREVASLSEADVLAMRAGRGMGLALPAELNGYPGPMHVLEHAAAITLSPEQTERVKATFDRMKRRAIAAGEAYIAA
jgi:hypothetical protein